MLATPFCSNKRLERMRLAGIGGTLLLGYGSRINDIGAAHLVANDTINS